MVGDKIFFTKSSFANLEINYASYASHNQWDVNLFVSVIDLKALF